MREALILAGLTIGAVVAFFGNDSAPASPSTIGTEAAIPGAENTTTSGSAAVMPSSGATELRRAGDGHFYAGVSTNGRAITMLVDTGASVVALTGADARAAGLHWNPAQLGVVAQGASGPIRGVALRLDRVALGSHEARNVEAVIIPEGLSISLLGQSFLATIEPVRIEKDRMVLGGV
ncbi:MAG TPA: TIGR02281 family clan AA aspartic protease [Qipengyuania sp.]|nr:TIGR02281 family clan AA aspartic protease [Qipengyuania sp.]